MTFANPAVLGLMGRPELPSLYRDVELGRPSTLNQGAFAPESTGSLGNSDDSSDFLAFSGEALGWSAAMTDRDAVPVSGIAAWGAMLLILVGVLVAIYSWPIGGGIAVFGLVWLSDLVSTYQRWVSEAHAPSSNGQ